MTTKYYLNMIVRNESPVVCRALQSALNVFGADLGGVLITDTGSTDDTMKIIKDFCEHNKIRHVEVLEDKWSDFATNRSVALWHAQHYLSRNLSTADFDEAFIVFLDADEEYQLDQVPRSTAIPADVNVLFTKVCMGNLRYERLVGVRASMTGARYESALHEYLVVPGMNKGALEGITIKVNTDGHRSQDPDKYLKDVELLRGALHNLSEKDEHLRPRYQYYLAQSYKDSGQPRRAEEEYFKRSIMPNTWEEEAWHAAYQSACLLDPVDGDAGRIVPMLAAWNRRPWRPEPLVKVLRMLNQSNQFNTVLALASFFAERVPERIAEDVLFLEEDAMWRVQDEKALASFYSGYRSGALGIWQNILTRIRGNPAYAADVARIEANLKFC